jgi:hypothetical protein
MSRSLADRYLRLYGDTDDWLIEEPTALAVPIAA